MLTRVPYFDQAAQMPAGSTVRVEAGSQANRVFVLDATVEAVGRSSLSFATVVPLNYAVDATLLS